MARFKSLKTTADIPIPKSLAEQIVGQERAVEIIRKAARQKRNVLLIGSPGCGKSMLAQAMAEMMPVEKLEDVLIYPNAADPNNPKVRIVPAGEGKKTVEEEQKKSSLAATGELRPGFGGFFFMSILFSLIIIAMLQFKIASDTIIAAFIIVGGLFLGFLVFASAFATGMRQFRFTSREAETVPKLLIDNSGKTTASFVEATGAHSGALLGDVLHDPLQTIFPDSTVFKVEERKIRPLVLKELVDELLEKHRDLVVNAVEGYEGVILPEEEKIFILGCIDGAVKPVRVYVVNRRKYDGEMIAVKKGDSRVLVTPEHKVFVNVDYVEADKLDASHASGFFQHSFELLIREDLLNTFSHTSRERAESYMRFCALKAQQNCGYKKAARLLSVPAGRTRWWYSKAARPVAVKTVDWLESRNLLPLRSGDSRLPAIARVLGATFGDGGIAGNLNNIFLSSTEQSSLDAFKEDLMAIFGGDIKANFSVIKSGVNGTGRCLRNTDRAVVRFFIALGAPVGRKNKELKIPAWIYLNEECRKEFFGALFGSELCSPAFSITKGRIDSFDIALCGAFALKETRIKFLEAIKRFLNSYGIKCNSIYENEFRAGSFLWRLCISKELENLQRFKQFIPIRYSENKKRRLNEAINYFKEWKDVSFERLCAESKTEKYITTTLRAPLVMLQALKQHAPVFSSDRINFDGTIYNVTTESGNLLANNLLISNSGGLGTPPHIRIQPGAIHKANKGVLFIDEIASLSPKSQQELLTAMQEKKYSITGQSEMSSGAQVRTEPVPCDFVLVASGNVFDLEKMHPALRSRIRGYGYEVYLNEYLDEMPANQRMLEQFVAQEISKDAKIPHFSREAVDEIISEAKRRAGRKNKYTMRLRDLGGLVRAAGDIARSEGAALVERAHVLRGKGVAQTLEQQVAERFVAQKKEYEVIKTHGFATGRVNGLAVVGDSVGQFGGMLLPIEAEVAMVARPGAEREGRIIATGRLGEIAKEAVENVSAVIKKYKGFDISAFDIHIQFLQSYERVEGDSASVSVATAVLSALEKIPVDQNMAMTGSVSVKGEVLPVGGVTAKAEAALEAGIKTLVVPEANKADLVLDSEKKKKIRIVAVRDLCDVLRAALKEGPQKKQLIRQIAQIIR